MNISVDVVKEKGVCLAIRDRLTCGRCTASTLLIWKAKRIGTGPRDTAVVTVADGDGYEVESANFLVRCSFFRMNIAEPQDVLVCEGFKDRRADKNCKSGKKAKDEDQGQSVEEEFEPYLVRPVTQPDKYVRQVS